MAKKQSKAKVVRAPRRALQDGEIKRTYKGTEHTVTITGGVIEYQGETYKSLTALAREITGYKAISGPAFFAKAKEAVEA